jgi:hypothetical protein
MSDSGEVEVETSGYQVLPKEVTDEIGSIKLFNKWYVELGQEGKLKLEAQLLILSPLQVLRRCGNPRYLPNVRIPIFPISKLRRKNAHGSVHRGGRTIANTSQRLHPNPCTSLHLPLGRSIRTKEIQKGAMPNHRASHQLVDDEWS